MRCPRCGLIHSPTDQVCRRCEIDLVSGEPRRRVGACPSRPTPIAPVIETSVGPIKDRERDHFFRTRSDQARVEPKRKPDLEIVVLNSEGGEKISSEPGALDSSAKPRFFFGWLGGFLGLSGVNSIRCVQCNGSMRIERERPYSRSGPISLLVLGAVLLVIGIFFHYLLISAVVSILAGVIYLRVGASSWKCLSCGLIIPRS